MPKLSGAQILACFNDLNFSCNSGWYTFATAMRIDAPRSYTWYRIYLAPIVWSTRQDSLIHIKQWDILWLFCKWHIRSFLFFNDRFLAFLPETVSDIIRVTCILVINCIKCSCFGTFCWWYFKLSTCNHIFLYHRLSCGCHSWLCQWFCSGNGYQCGISFGLSCIYCGLSFSSLDLFNSSVILLLESGQI